VNRRDFIKSAGLTSVAAVSGTAAATQNKQVEHVCATELHPDLRKASSAPRKRQVIVILEESVRYDMLNCNRQTGLRTPYMDRLAVSGMRFTKAYNCQPVCSPARPAVWTGASPHTNGVWGNSMQLGRNVHTIGQRLSDQGIHCAFMGKWHLSATDYFDSGICPPGWDPQYWYDMRTFLMELSPEDRVKSRQPATSDDPTWPAEKCYAYRVAKRAVDFLKHHGNEEFLLCVAFDEPHGPSIAPRQYSQSYKDFKFPSNPNQADPMTDKPVSQDLWSGTALRHGIHPIHQPHYFGSHTFCDDQIGRVLDQIQQSAPDEMHNLIGSAEHASIRNGLHDRILAWMDDTRDPFRGYYWTTRPWRPDIKANFHCSGMMRITPYDGYLPRDLVYETGLDATKNVYWKPM